MKIIQSLKALVNVKEKQSGLIIRLIKDKSEISKALHEAKESGKVIGIYCPLIGDGMFLVGVEEIHTYGTNLTVTLKRHDLSGALLPRYEFSLAELRSVCPFDTQYVNPMLKLKVHHAA